MVSLHNSWLDISRQISYIMDASLVCSSAVSHSLIPAICKEGAVNEVLIRSGVLRKCRPLAASDFAAFSF